MYFVDLGNMRLHTRRVHHNAVRVAVSPTPSSISPPRAVLADSLTAYIIELHAEERLRAAPGGMSWL